MACRPGKRGGMLWCVGAGAGGEIGVRVFRSAMGEMASVEGGLLQKNYERYPRPDICS